MFEHCLHTGTLHPGKVNGVLPFVKVEVAANGGESVVEVMEVM